MMIQDGKTTARKEDDGKRINQDGKRKKRGMDIKPMEPGKTTAQNGRRIDSRPPSWLR